MNPSFELLSPTDPKWSRYLDQTDHDFFHTAAYHRLWERSGHGRAFLAVYGTPGRFVAWPYLLNSLQSVHDGESGTDVTSVYGYAGPVCLGCSDQDELLRVAWTQIVDCWRRQGVVSVFARLHPVLANHRIIADTPADRAEAGPGIVHHGETVAIRLDGNEQDTWLNYRAEVRKNLRRAEKIGLESVIDAEWRYFEEFLALYSATMERNHASSFYFFPREYLDGLRQALGEHGGLIVSRFEGRIVAGCLLTECHGIASTHLTAGELGVEGCSPAKVLVHDAQLWARRRGNYVLHLGGGRGNHEDSLFAFKTGFSPQRDRFSTGRWILDLAKYDELTRLHLQQANQAGASVEPGFFPAYRAPMLARGDIARTLTMTAGGSS